MKEGRGDIERSKWCIITNKETQTIQDGVRQKETEISNQDQVNNWNINEMLVDG